MTETLARAAFQARLTLTVQTALSIGAGGSSGGTADKSVVRDASNRLIVPGSHLKGKLRHACEAIARAAGYRVCSGPQADAMCPIELDPDKAENKQGLITASIATGEERQSGYFCIVCQLFGAPGLTAPLKFADLRAQIPGAELTALRPGVSVNRRRRVAEDKRLYYTETSRPGLKLRFSHEAAITGYLPRYDGGPSEEEYLKLLTAGLASLQQWGGGKTRGLGWASLQFEFATHPRQWFPPNFRMAGPASIPPTPAFAKVDGVTEFSLSLTALSPLSLGDRRPNAQFRQSQPFIPGRVLRGSLAESLRVRDPDLFQALFGEPEGQYQNRFGHALPAYQPKGSQEYFPSFRAPFTTRRCKDEEEHRVFDILFDQLASELKEGGPVYSPRCLHPDHNNDPTAGRAENYSGLLVVLKDENQQVQGYATLKDPAQRLLTRVAINRKRATAEDSLLYSPLVINEGYLFTVRFRLQNSELAARLLDFLAQERFLRVGGGTSRGLGLLQISDLEMLGRAGGTSEIQSRVEQFNTALKQRLVEGWNLPDSENLLYFTVEARSDLALTEPEGWNRSLLPSLAIPGARLVRAFASSTYRSGWNNAWGLLRDNVLMAAAGSVYLFALPYDRLNENFYPSLAQLEQEGLGEGRGEGYGDIVICEAFHYLNLSKETTHE